MVDQNQIDGIAERLRQARSKIFATATDAAKAHGWAESTYFGHENGSRGISRSKIIMYARAFRVSSNWLLTGREGAELIQIARRVAVVGEVAAGIWQEHNDWDEEKFDGVPIVPGRYEALDQFAFLVRGPSMDQAKIFDGDFVVCVKYWDARTTITDGDAVVIARRNGTLVERTVKRIRLRNSMIDFVPESSDPRFQKPITVERGVLDASDSSVEIIGLVIGNFRWQ